MVLLKGNETPSEIISLAYGMEEGLRGFYDIMAKKSRDPAVSSLLSRLAAIEMAHKERLYRLYAESAPDPLDQKGFEETVVSGTMEGGFTTEEFIEQNRPALETPPDVISLAMMLETQSLDLYLRISQKSLDETSRKVLHELAEEEKAHLSTLGRLMEAQN